jgi:hypothetical protein
MLQAISQPLDWPDQLIELLERQLSLAQRLIELATGQAALISCGRTDELLGLLGQRQRLVDAFVATQEDLGRFTVDLDERISQANPGTRRRIRELLGAIGDALVDVMARDNADQQALQTNCDATRQELTGIGAARAARSAYRPAGPAAPLSRFSDQHG